MTEPKKIDDTMLEAFIDGQLDAENSELVIKTMDEDPGLRDHVYQLRKTKELMKLGYGYENPPDTNPGRYTRPLRNQCIKRIAAVSATIAIGLGSAFVGYNLCIHAGHAPIQTLADLRQQQDERIILHVSESDPRQFEVTLTYIEKLLNDHMKNGKARIEVVANAGGIDLLRADYPLSDKVMSIMDEHDNITFIACTNAINRLRSQGIDPSMIVDVETEKAALNHIIERLRTGWTYIKVDSETLRI